MGPGSYLPHINSEMIKYIYEHKNWTAFTWQDRIISVVFGEVRQMQGEIIGQMDMPGFSERTKPRLRR